MKGVFFLVVQYLRPKKSIISILTYISILGPLLGVCVLVVITSVMNGFPIALQKKIIEYESDISIKNKDNSTIINPQFILKELAKENIKGSPVTNFYGFIQRKDKIIPVKTKGIETKYDQQVSQLKKYITLGDYNIKPKQCLIGEALAFKHNLYIGDKIILHSPERYASLLNFNEQINSTNRVVETNQTLTLTIVGFFSYGYSNVDNNFIYIHIDDANDMVNINWGEAKEIETAIPNPFKALNLTRELAKKKYLQNYDLIPWQTKHKDYYQTVQREKALITFTLFFIMIGSAIGIAATLFSLIIQKTKEIGILKSLGVSRKQIVTIFLFQGSFIGISGSFIGLILGLIILKFRNEIFRSLWSPKAYFLQDIPSLIMKEELSIIILIACIICILGALIPAIFAALIKPIHALNSDK